jgi:hypothetical protein
MRTESRINSSCYSNFMHRLGLACAMAKPGQVSVQTISICMEIWVKIILGKNNNFYYLLDL